MVLKRMEKAFVVIFVFLMVFTVFPGSVSAQECRVIRIHGMAMHDSIRIEPGVTTISKGTCVIWFNRASANELRVVFEEGKKCSNVTDAPTGFILRKEDGCYVTGLLPFGGTSSLRFLETGSFDYKIVNAGDRKVAEGTVLVQ